MAFTDVSTGGRVMQQGIMPYKLVLEDTCNVGDGIGFDEASEVWERADADGKAPMDFVAGEKCETSGDTITVFRQAIVSGLGSAAIGDPVYLGNTKGTYTAYPESWIHQQVGICISATEIMLSPNAMALFSYAKHGVGWGTYIRAELNDSLATQTSQVWGGLRVDFKADTSATITGDAYGIYVFAQLTVAPGESSAMLRLDDGCSASCGVDAWIMFVGGPDLDPPDYLFTFSTLEPTNGAWSDSTAASATPTGRLKIQVGGQTRYIAITSS